MALTPTALVCGPRFKTNKEFDDYVKIVYCYRHLKNKGYNKTEAIALVDYNYIECKHTPDEVVKWCEGVAPREVVFGKQGDSLEKDS